MRFWYGLTWKQRILDGLCILLCLAQIIYVVVNYASLPEKLPMNYDFAGNVTGYGNKPTIIILLVIDCVVTASLCLMLRLPNFYKQMNVPWPVPWGREALIVSATKDFLCWCNLCMTAIFTDLCWCIASQRSPGVLVWIPTAALLPLTVWFILRLRNICKRP